jgi:hypothetical protein
VHLGVRGGRRALGDVCKDGTHFVPIRIAPWSIFALHTLHVDRPDLAYSTQYVAMMIGATPPLTEGTSRARCGTSAQVLGTLALLPLSGHKKKMDDVLKDRFKRKTHVQAAVVTASVHCGAQPLASMAEVSAAPRAPQRITPRSRARTDLLPPNLPQAEGKKALDAPGFESGAFEALESDFQEERPPPARGPRGACGSNARLACARARPPPSRRPPAPSQVLQELVGDKSLERFRAEYDKLHRALKKSHDSEKRLIKKCRELNQARAPATRAPLAPATRAPLARRPPRRRRCRRCRCRGCCCRGCCCRRRCCCCSRS